MAKAYCIDLTTSTVRAFASTKIANENATEADDVIVSAIGFGAINASIAQLTALFNALAGEGDKIISKFPDRATALSRTFDRIAAVPVSEVVEIAELPPAKGGKPGKKAPAPKKIDAEETGPRKPRGRVSVYSGKFIYPSKETMEENPRREETLGFQALELIRQNPGISYDEWIAAGGAGNHFKWDLDRGHIVIEKEPRKK